MLTFAALLLLELAARQTDPPQCKNLTAKHNFNAEAFFTGTWYLTHIDVAWSPEKVNLEVCISSKSQLSPPQLRQTFTVSIHLPNGLVKSDNIEGWADVPQRVGKYELKFGKQDDEMPTFPITTTIIETDYDNYAIGYYCLGTIENPNETYDMMFGIWGRSPNPSKVNSNVDAVLNKLGLKLSDFSSSKKLNCPGIQFVYVKKKLY